MTSEVFVVFRSSFSVIDSKMIKVFVIIVFEGSVYMLKKRALKVNIIRASTGEK